MNLSVTQYSTYPSNNYENNPLYDVKHAADNKRYTAVKAAFFVGTVTFAATTLLGASIITTVAATALTTLATFYIAIAVYKQLNRTVEIREMTKEQDKSDDEIEQLLNRDELQRLILGQRESQPIDIVIPPAYNDGLGDLNALSAHNVARINALEANA